VAELDEIAERAQLWRDVIVVGDVVAVIQPRAGVKRQQPDAIDAELGDRVEAVGQALEIADAVIAAVHVGGDIEGIDDRALVPKVEHCSLAGSITKGGSINVRDERLFQWTSCIVLVSS
jgi:hypothetical protein